MYGDKSQEKYIKSEHGRKKINLEYFITKEEFSELYHKSRIGLKKIAKEINYEKSFDQFRKDVNERNWRELGRLTYEYDSEFFKSWNERSAWVYGWLLTDGYMIRKERVGIELQACDIDVLMKIREATSFSGDVLKTKRGSVTLTLCKKEIVNDLISLGFPSEAKSYNCEIPAGINKDFMWAFMRGIFEGDGTISVEEGQLRISLCGVSDKLIYGVKDYLSLMGIHSSVHRKSSGVLILRSKDMGSALRWAYFMYVGTTDKVRMHRKFSKFVDFVNGYYGRKRISSECIALVELARQTIPECSEMPIKNIAI